MSAARCGELVGLLLAFPAPLRAIQLQATSFVQLPCCMHFKSNPASAARFKLRLTRQPVLPLTPRWLRHGHGVQWLPSSVYFEVQGQR